MGSDLFPRHPDRVQTADAILGYSIARLCEEDPDHQLSRTQYTQPALFVVNALTYLDWRNAGNPPPDIAAGHSLGEYNALFAAGAFDFETGLGLVKKRAELMAAVKDGAMAAVLGLAPDRIREILDHFGFDEVDVANLNSPKQTVIAGREDDIQAVAFVFEESGAVYKRLPVSGAFHSRMMRPLRESFESHLSTVRFRSPEIPVISNVLGAPYPPDGLPGLLARQLSEPVRWMDGVRWMLGQGAIEIKELGPGRVLTGLEREIRRDMAAPTAAA